MEFQDLRPFLKADNEELKRLNIRSDGLVKFFLKCSIVEIYKQFILEKNQFKKGESNDNSIS